jgi:hypothetical protein
MCTTPVYQKANGDCGCGFTLPGVFNWNSAFAQCKSKGASLPEVITASENTNLFNLKVCTDILFIKKEMINFYSAFNRHWLGVK